MTDYQGDDDFVPRPFEYDMTDDEVLEDLKEYPVELLDSLENVVAVDNIPSIPMTKFQKLVKVLMKYLTKYGNVLEFYMPHDAKSNKTYGYAFVEYENPGQAQVACMEGSKVRLDKRHVLKVNKFEDFERYEDVPEQFEVKNDEYENKENTTGWLQDGRSQYLVRYQLETEIYWNESARINDNGRILENAGETHKQKNKNWTESATAWSSQGSYLATFHNQGIALWGGDGFHKLGRLAHADVKMIDFSPKENYVVTCNAKEPTRPGDPECVIVWDTRTKKKLRGFDGGVKVTWPSFSWSSDDSYIARLSRDKQGRDQISIYEVPGMGLLDKKSVKVPGVQEMQWCPNPRFTDEKTGEAQQIISYWVPEKDNVPAKVTLRAIPSREVVREIHLYSVQNIKMHWHPQGTYFAVKMDRQKSKKKFHSNFEIFRMRAKNVPVERLEMEDQIVAFAWEPVGSRFAIIHTDGKKNDVSFYQLKKKKLVHLATLENKDCNCLYWSPQGTYIVLAGLGAMNGMLEVVDVDTMYTLTQCDHFMCTDVEWDPTGRYVITSVTQPFFGSGNWRYAMENGYKVWTLDGKGRGLFVQTTAQKLESCYQVMWRPRPKTLLTWEEQKDVKENVKRFQKQFEAEDEKMRAEQLGRKAKERLEMKENWKAYRAERMKERNENRQARIDLRAGLLSDDEDDYIQEEIETEVEISVNEETVE